MKKKNDELKQNLVKLAWYIGFLIFFVLLIIMTGGNDPKTNKQESPKEDINEEVTYKDKQNILINGEYDYVFTYNDTIYKGHYSNHERVGEKTTKDKTIKYVEIENVAYDENKEIIENIYENMDKTLLDFSELFDKINSSSTIINREGDFIIYKYDDVNDYKIEVKCDTNYILSIKINEEYTFTFEY